MLVSFEFSKLRQKLGWPFSVSSLKAKDHCCNGHPNRVTEFLKKILNFNLIFKIYLFLAVLGLRCCAWAFSSCSERGLLFVAVHGLLIAVASLVAEHGL